MSCPRAHGRALESTAGNRLAPILSRYYGLYPDVVVELVTGTYRRAGEFAS